MLLHEGGHWTDDLVLTTLVNTDKRLCVNRSSESSRLCPVFPELLVPHVVAAFQCIFLPMSPPDVAWGQALGKFRYLQSMREFMEMAHYLDLTIRLIQMCGIQCRKHYMSSNFQDLQIYNTILSDSFP